MPILDPAANFAYGTVLTPPSPPTTGTTIVLNSAEGASFPDPSGAGAYNVAVFPAYIRPSLSNAEIVRVTARSSDTLTVTRQQESTSAKSIIAGDQVVLTTSALFRDTIETALNNIGFDNFDTDFTDVTGIIDGLFFEKVDFTVVSDSGLQLDVEALGGGDLHAWIGGEKTTLDCTTGGGVDGKARLALTAGVDANNPVSNYVYMTNSGGVASLNTSTAFPTGAFGWIGHILLPDATTWATTGAYTIQRTTESFLNDSRGALSHEREKIRAMGGTYISGVSQTIAITTNGGSADNVHLETTQGVVKQMHDQTFPAFLTGPYYYGNGVNQYERITDLNAALSDSDGNSLSGTRFNLTLWGSVNMTTGECKVFVNLPNGSYNKDDQAISDRDNTADQSIPPSMRGTAFLIARVALRHQTLSSGTWSSLGVFSLLGAPLGAQAGGAGSIAANSFDDNVFSIFDTDDPTKNVKFQVSGVTTGTTRTLTVPDSDGTIALEDYVDTKHSFSVYRNAALTLNGFTKITCDTEEFDRGGNFDSTTNNRFVATIAGDYQFNGAVHGQGLADTNRLIAILYKNAVEFKRGADVTASGTADTGASVSHVIHLEVDDYVELFAYSSVSRSALVGAVYYNHFSGHLVERT